jgi:dCTP deaminase
MILTGDEIIREYNIGRIKITPFNEKQINPNSYDFRLGHLIKIYKNEVLDPTIKQETFVIDIRKNDIVLYPNKIYLAHTFETMGSDFYVPIIRAKSSVARLGLFIHVTADLIDIGSYNEWTLQLHAVQPVKLSAGMLIGQVTFWTVKGVISLYSGKYQGSKGPHESQIYKDFLNEEVI